MAARGGKEAWEGVICSFLVSENRQGVLLPDNTDPWKKLPDSIPEKKAVCTYLEMRGDYNDDGITISDMGFRMYLGNDATTDFDIVRNTAYTVTVGINDKATAELLSWKVVSGSKDDKRKLSWSPNPDTLFCEKTLTVTPNLGVTQKSTRFDFSFEGLDGLGVTYTRSGNSLTFTSSKQLSEVKKFYVTASTPDGRHSSKLTVVVQPRYPVKLEADCPGYGGTGVWAWDFYKIGGNVSYSVKAFFNDHTNRYLSASEYTVSNNTRSDLVDFTTNGTVRYAGSTDVGGDGSVNFSYSENGKTVSLTKTWRKLYVVGFGGTADAFYLDDCQMHLIAVRNDGSSYEVSLSEIKPVPPDAHYSSTATSADTSKGVMVKASEGKYVFHALRRTNGVKVTDPSMSHRDVSYECTYTIYKAPVISGMNYVHSSSGDLKQTLRNEDADGVTDISAGLKHSIWCGGITGETSILDYDIWKAYAGKEGERTATVYGSINGRTTSRNVTVEKKSSD